jgi:hypothetical protein
VTGYTFTINTDASHHPQTKVSAWACWIKSSHYLIKASGLFPEPVANSSIAEIMAVEQALILLDNLIHDQPFLSSRTERIKLIINTDSMWTIQALNNNVKRSKHLRIARKIRALTYCYDIETRHVKAHTTRSDARSWVNDWCDKASKSLVRQRIEELNGRKEV